MSPSTLSAAFEEARALDAPLSERLGAYARSLRAFRPDFAEAVDRLVARLREGTLVAGAPKEGDAMPAFLLPDHAGRLVALDELVAQGPVAVTFARGHWCPYCRIAVSSLADVADDIRDAGAQVVVIVPDRQQYAAKLKADAHAPFSILTDLDNGYAMSLGLVFWVGEELQRLMQSRGISPQESQGNESCFVPVPATFIVGRDGRIAARHVDPDYRKRMEMDAVVAALKAAAGA
ncbi:MAG TPA: peroxiredoxin-like family protein [Hyphomicrobiaceae bacterium]